MLKALTRFSLWHRNLALPISIAFGIAVLAYSLHTSKGPVYTASDEVAYLAKAAFLAGKPVDFASDWFLGYPALIAPIFIIFNKISVIWPAILIVNSLFWVGSSILVSRLLARFAVELNCVNNSTRNNILLATCAYPSWATFSGYAFPNAAFSFFFIVALSTVPNFNHRLSLRSIAHFCSVSFLCWIHPVGYAVLIASAAINLTSQRFGPRTFLKSGIVVAVSVGLAILHLAVNKYVNSLMTPSGFPIPDHYFDHVIDQSASLFTLNSLIGLSKQFLTVSAALVIATFGSVNLLLDAATRFKYRESSSRTYQNCILFIAISLLGVICLTTFSLFAPVRATMQLDHWIFLRYAEMILMPALAFGFAYMLSSSLLQRIRNGLFSVAVLTLSAIFLNRDLADRGATSAYDNHFVMSAGFWPYGFDSSINPQDWHQTPVPADLTYPNFVVWFIIGGLGLFTVLFFRNLILIPITFVILATSMSVQTKWHDFLMYQYADRRIPKELSRDSCSAYVLSSREDPVPDRYGLLTVELVGTNFRRLTFPEEFRGLTNSALTRVDLGCDNPLLFSANKLLTDSSTQFRGPAYWLDFQLEEDLWLTLPASTASRRNLQIGKP